MRHPRLLKTHTSAHTRAQCFLRDLLGMSEGEFGRTEEGAGGGAGRPGRCVRPKATPPKGVWVRVGAVEMTGAPAQTLAAVAHTGRAAWGTAGPLLLTRKRRVSLAVDGSRGSYGPGLPAGHVNFRRSLLSDASPPPFSTVVGYVARTGLSPHHTLRRI